MRPDSERSVSRTTASPPPGTSPTSSRAGRMIPVSSSVLLLRLERLGGEVEEVAEVSRCRAAVEVLDPEVAVDGHDPVADVMGPLE